MGTRKSEVTKVIVDSGEYAVIPNIIFQMDISPIAKLIWCTVMSHSDNWWVSKKWLKENLRVGMATIEAAIAELESKSMLFCETGVDSKGGSFTKFILVSPSNWRGCPEEDREGVLRRIPYKKKTKEELKKREKEEEERKNSLEPTTPSIDLKDSAESSDFDDVEKESVFMDVAEEPVSAQKDKTVASSDDGAVALDVLLQGSENYVDAELYDYEETTSEETIAFMFSEKTKKRMHNNVAVILKEIPVYERKAKVYEYIHAAIFKEQRRASFWIRPGTEPYVSLVSDICMLVKEDPKKEVLSLLKAGR